MLTASSNRMSVDLRRLWIPIIRRSRLFLATLSIAIKTVGVIVIASGAMAAEPAIPNYQRVADWPTLPASMKLGPVSSVAIDTAGRVYVLQRTQPPVVVFDGKGEFLRTWGEGFLKIPHGLRIDRNDNVWMTDIGNHIVLKCDAEGNVLLTLGRKGEAGSGPDQFNKPTDVAFSAAGDVFVSDGYGNSRIVKFSKEGRYLAEWGTKGTGRGEFNLPHTLCTDGKDRLYVGDLENNRVQVFNLDGKFLDQFTESGAPFSLALKSDRLFVADGRARQINVLNLQGKRLGHWSTGDGDSNTPHWVSVDSHGTAYVSYVSGQRIDKFTAK